MSVALLLTNNLDNSKQKRSNLLSPAPPPYSWSLLGKCEGPAHLPPLRPLDVAWNPAIAGFERRKTRRVYAAMQASATMCRCMCVHCVCVYDICMHTCTQVYAKIQTTYFIRSHFFSFFQNPLYWSRGGSGARWWRGDWGLNAEIVASKLNTMGISTVLVFNGEDILKLPTNHPSVTGTTYPVSVCLVQCNTTVGLIKNSWKPQSGVTCQHSPTSPVRPYITCTTTQHHMYDNTSHVQQHNNTCMTTQHRPHNITCTTKQHHMYNNTCMTTQHHMYDHTTCMTTHQMYDNTSHV